MSWPVSTTGAGSAHGSTFLVVHYLFIFSSNQSPLHLSTQSFYIFAHPSIRGVYIPTVYNCLQYSSFNNNNLSIVSKIYSLRISTVSKGLGIHLSTLQLYLQCPFIYGIHLSTYAQYLFFSLLLFTLSTHLHDPPIYVIHMYVYISLFSPPPPSTLPPLSRFPPSCLVSLLLSLSLHLSVYPFPLSRVTTEFRGYGISPEFFTSIFPNFRWNLH